MYWFQLSMPSDLEVGWRKHSSIGNKPKPKRSETCKDKYDVISNSMDLPFRYHLLGVVKENKYMNNIAQIIQTNPSYQEKETNI